MNTEKNIFIAFLLNFTFSIFEFVGGIVTGSVAILSDALHDIGDASSIGISYFLEKKSKKQPDEQYTYGYARYSVFGGLVTTVILLVGSVMVIYNAVARIIHPTEIHYEGMILFAIIGILVNAGAAFYTRKGESLNQRAVNLHMLEDVLGWAVVLVGAIVMRFTDFAIIDPLMSIGVAAFILVTAGRNFKEVLDLFLEKTPCGISVAEVKSHVLTVEGVEDVHHIHLWSMDGQNIYATMHVVTDNDAHLIKEAIREELKELGVGHVTLELETQEEYCHLEECRIAENTVIGHHHHHH